ncbi:MAG: alpha/beta hydrolase [Solobacterium sp.]|nr:alpha/beta hydrolase [Solobacterium sp.]
MEFHTFGNPTDPVIVLIHGMLTPWQIWEEAVKHYSERFCVVVPELDAHTEETASAFQSITDEAEKLAAYLKQSFGGRTLMICGLSMGGRIAAEAVKDPQLHTDVLVLDGAPLIKLPGVAKTIMKHSYQNIIQKSRKRDPRVLESFKKDFLPENYLEPFLQIADRMEDTSIANIIDSVFSEFEFVPYENEMRILFLHGTKGNEAVSKKAALRLKEKNPQTVIRCFEGYAHAQLACYEPQKWIAETEQFLINKTA